VILPEAGGGRRAGEKERIVQEINNMTTTEYLARFGWVLAFVVYILSPSHSRMEGFAGGASLAWAAITITMSFERDKRMKQDGD
jgi:hypothetical protein